MTTTAKRPRRTRGDVDYQIEALSKGLAVLEALEGSGFEPVPIERIMERCHLPKDFVFRALRTLRLRGYAIQNGRGEWSVGNRILRFSKDYGQICLTTLTN